MRRNSEHIANKIERQFFKERERISLAWGISLDSAFPFRVAIGGRREALGGNNRGGATVDLMQGESPCGFIVGVRCGHLHRDSVDLPGEDH